MTLTQPIGSLGTSREPSLQAKYALERQGLETLECERGFCTYRFVPEHDGIYLVDIYVEPEARSSYLATNLADQVAAIGRQNQFQWMFGSVDPTTNGATDSCKIILKYGMELSHINKDDGLIIFKKRLDG